MEAKKRKTSSKITYEPLEGTKSCAVRQPESVGFTYSFLTLDSAQPSYIY